MKKMMMLAMMAAAATTGFAQDALVKEAKKLNSKGDFETAIQKLSVAVDASATLDKAAAWNEMVQAQYGKYNAIHAMEIENKVKNATTPFDTLAMNHAALASLKAAIKCDEFDRKPNEKGKVKVRFRNGNAQKMQQVRLALINAGLQEYNHKNLEGALDFWKSYLDSPTSELFSNMPEVSDVSKDQYRAEISYYAGLVAYQMKDYASAVKYATMASQDPNKAADAMEILLFARKDNLQSKSDSIEYLGMLKKLHAEDPKEERYFNLLMDYYNHVDNQNEVKAWAEEEISLNPQNKMAWAMKAQSQMAEQKWDEAVSSFEKAVQLDPTFVQCFYNAGVCLNSKAIDLKDQLADKATGGLTKANADKVKLILAEAKVFLEKAKELDPYREKANWAYPLYQIYYFLGDETNAAEMEKLVNGN